MNSASLSRMLSASLVLTASILPLVGQASQNHRLHKSHKRVTAKPVQKALRNAATNSKPLSALDKMALAHAVRRAANARSAKRISKSDEKESEEREREEEREKEGGNAQGITGGEEYMRRIRAYPNKSIDPTAFGRAITQRERLQPAYIGYAKSSKGGIGVQSLFPSATWSFVGPVNWYPTSQRAYYGLESMNGHLQSIVADPKNRLILYVASETGGVFKTTDGGVKWKSLSDKWLYLRTNALAIDPKNSLILYAGTGASPTGFGNAIGLMKTVDGGNTWTNIGANTDSSGNYLYFAGKNVTKVLVDPVNSNSITVLTGDTSIAGNTIHAADYNIWNSTNGGSTWSKKVGEFPYPGDGGLVYADQGTWDDAVVTKGNAYLAVGKGPGYTQSANNDILYRSTDQGINWTQVPNAPKPPADKTATNGARLAVSPINPNWVYLIYAYNDHLNLYRSVDNGVNWTNITVTSGINNMFPARNYELDQVPYDYYLGCSSRKVNNVATDVLYVGLKSVYQQVQTASNTVWLDVANAFGPLADIHSDQHCIAFDPTNADRGWFGNDGGIYQFYSNPTTGATTFLSLNDGLQTTQFYQTSYHPTNSSIMIGGAQDNGTAGAFGDLNAWQAPTAGDGVYTAINPLNPQNMYAGYVSGVIYRTDDMFQSGKTDISPDKTAAGTGSIAFVTPFVLDPNNPRYLYTAGQKLGRYDATTGTWTYFPTTITADQSSTLTVSPADSSRIYVASTFGGLYTTPDGGTTWVTLKTGAAGESLPVNNVGAILPDPANAKAVFVGISGVNVPGHLYYCADITAAVPTWTNLSGANAASALPDAALNTIAIDPADANILYIGNDVGIFQSPDRGATWTNATAPLGLPNVQVNDLKALPLQGYLYAGTWGRGIWRIRIRNNDPLSGLLLNPDRVNGGTSVAGTVLLGAAAPAGGTTVSLSSDTPSAASVPPTVTVPAGQTQTGFTVTTSPVGGTTPVKITASIGAGAGQTKTGTINVVSGAVVPAILDFYWSYMGSNYGSTFDIGASGSIDAQIVVTLNKASTSATTVALTTNDAAGITLPATAVIPAGQTSVTINITLNPVAAPEVIKVTAKIGFSVRTITSTRN